MQTRFFAETFFSRSAQITPRDLHGFFHRVVEAFSFCHILHFNQSPQYAPYFLHNCLTYQTSNGVFLFENTQTIVMAYAPVTTEELDALIAASTDAL